MTLLESLGLLLLIFGSILVLRTVILADRLAEPESKARPHQPAPSPLKRAA